MPCSGVSGWRAHTRHSQKACCRGYMWSLLCSAGAGGLGIGLAFGIACRYVLRFMRYMGASIEQQISLTVALAYLSYYTANAPAHVSGHHSW